MARRFLAVTLAVAATLTALGPPARSGPSAGADLSVSATDSPDPYNGWDDLSDGREDGITYRLVVRNNSGKSVDGVRMSGMWWGLELAGFQTTQGTCGRVPYSRQDYECSLGSIPGKGAATVTATMTACLERTTSATPFGLLDGGPGVFGFAYTDRYDDPNWGNNDGGQTTDTILGPRICEG